MQTNKWTSLYTTFNFIQFAYIFSYVYSLNVIGNIAIHKLDSLTVHKFCKQTWYPPDVR